MASSFLSTSPVEMESTNRYVLRLPVCNGPITDTSNHRTAAWVLVIPCYAGARPWGGGTGPGLQALRSQRHAPSWVSHQRLDRIGPRRSTVAASVGARLGSWRRSAIAGEVVGARGSRRPPRPRCPTAWRIPVRMLRSACCSHNSAPVSLGDASDRRRPQAADRPERPVPAMEIKRIQSPQNS